MQLLGNKEIPMIMIDFSKINTQLSFDLSHNFNKYKI